MAEQIGSRHKEYDFPEVEYQRLDKRFAERAGQIERGLSLETSGPLRIRGIDFDETQGHVKVDIGIVHNTKKDRNTYGATATWGIACMNLGRKETATIQAEIKQRTSIAIQCLEQIYKSETVSDKFNIMRRMYLEKTFGTRDKGVIVSILQRMVIEQVMSPFFSAVTHIDSEHHGFGGSAFAIEKYALENLTRWDLTDSDEAKKSRRMTVLWSIMGSEGTRVQRFAGKRFRYRLEEHGKQQVTHAVSELLSFVNAYKMQSQEMEVRKSPFLVDKLTDGMKEQFGLNVEYQQYDAPKIETVTIKGHSMGGYIAYAIGAHERDFMDILIQKKRDGQLLDIPPTFRYILDATLTQGYLLNPREALLLQGFWGWTMRTATYVMPQVTMPIAKRWKIFRTAHKSIFGSEALGDYRDKYLAHIVQAERDPRYIDQCVWTLMHTPDMDNVYRNATPKEYEVLQKELMWLIVEGRMYADISDVDSVLHSKEQKRSLNKRYVPHHTSPFENHYKLQRTLAAVFTKGELDPAAEQEARLLFEDWMAKMRVIPDGNLAKIVRMYRRQHALFSIGVDHAIRWLQHKGKLSVSVGELDAIRRLVADRSLPESMRATIPWMIQELVTAHEHVTGTKIVLKEKEAESLYRSLNRSMRFSREIITGAVNRAVKTISVTDSQGVYYRNALAVSYDWKLRLGTEYKTFLPGYRDVLIEHRNRLVKQAKRRRHNVSQVIAENVYSDILRQILTENGIQQIPLNDVEPLEQVISTAQILVEPERMETGTYDLRHHPLIEEIRKERLFDMTFTVTIIDRQIELVGSALIPHLVGVFRDADKLMASYMADISVHSNLLSDGRSAFRLGMMRALEHARERMEYSEELEDFVQFVTGTGRYEKDKLPDVHNTKPVNSFMSDPSARRDMVNWYQTYIEKLRRILIACPEKPAGTAVPVAMFG